MALDHEGMPDEVLPSAASFVLAPRDHPDKGFLLGTETGTCLTLPSQFVEHRRTMRLHEVPPDKLVLRETAVVDVAAAEGETIGAEAIEHALAATDVRAGDALLLRTGWGDRGFERLSGTRYLLAAPRLAAAAATRLVDAMRTRDSDLLLTDLPLIARPEAHQIPEWLSLIPRPLPWPSAESRVYLHLYTPEKARADYAVARTFAAAGIMTVKRLVNCGAIESRRLRVIVGPLHLVRGVGSTCRVIAVAP